MENAQQVIIFLIIIMFIYQWAYFQTIENKIKYHSEGLKEEIKKNKKV